MLEIGEFKMKDLGSMFKKNEKIKSVPDGYCPGADCGLGHAAGAVDHEQDVRDAAGREAVHVDAGVVRHAGAGQASEAEIDRLDGVDDRPVGRVDPAQCDDPAAARVRGATP